MRTSKSQCVLVSFVAALAVTAGPALAVGIYEGFEDGNTTVNPTWFDANPGYGSASVVADPDRPGNLVWKAQGTPSGADRAIATTNFAPMSWVGFHSSVEVRCTGGYYNGGLIVADNWQKIILGTGEGFRVGFVEGHSSHASMTAIGIMEFSPTGSVMHWQNWDSSAAPKDEWQQVNLWHDPASGLIKADLRRLSDGYVYAETSITPMSFGESPLAVVELGGGGPGGADWSYLDNLTVTPEPATLSLLALGGLTLVRRRQ